MLVEFNIICFFFEVVTVYLSFSVLKVTDPPRKGKGDTERECKHNGHTTEAVSVCEILISIPSGFYTLHEPSKSYMFLFTCPYFRNVYNSVTLHSMPSPSIKYLFLVYYQSF